MGDPGVGKTALLAESLDRVDGVHVLRATGTEAEQAIAFAGLHLLLRPALHLLDTLPEPQSEALSSALALRAGVAGDRFAIGAATLALLCRYAEQTPIAVVVDDLQWLDRPSAEALAFAARRIDDDPVVVLLAGRTGACEDLVDGLAVLELAGLDAASSRRAGALAGDDGADRGSGGPALRGHRRQPARAARARPEHRAARRPRPRPPARAARRARGRVLPAARPARRRHPDRPARRRRRQRRPPPDRRGLPAARPRRVRARPRRAGRSGLRRRGPHRNSPSPGPRRRLRRGRRVAAPRRAPDRRRPAAGRRRAAGLAPGGGDLGPRRRGRAAAGGRRRQRGRPHGVHRGEHGVRAGGPAEPGDRAVARAALRGGRGGVDGRSPPPGARPARRDRVAAGARGHAVADAADPRPDRRAQRLGRRRRPHPRARRPRRPHARRHRLPARRGAARGVLPRGRRGHEAAGGGPAPRRSRPPRPRTPGRSASPPPGCRRC